MVKRLNVDPQGLSTLSAKVEEREAALAALDAEQAEQNQQEAATEEEAPAPEEKLASIPEPEKIIPAKIINRGIPDYPNQAARRSIEGWVNVQFDINIKGEPINIVILDSEPVKTFDKSAIASVKKSRFSPARSESTGLPVKTKNVSMKVNFKLK